MEKKSNVFISKESKEFVCDFLLHLDKSRNYDEKKDNDKTVNSAVLYERLRVALEYQEEHLVFKNAIARIIRRKHTLLPTITAEQLLNDLVSELSWADYLNPEAINQKTLDEIQTTLERYLILLKNTRSGRFSRHDQSKMLINWLASEIDGLLNPKKQDDVLVDYAYSILNSNLIIEGSRISPKENALELQFTIYNLLIKPDLATAQYWLILKIYPNWKEYSIDDIKKFGRIFDPYYNKIDRIINHPFRMRYVQYVKRNISPFLVIRTALVSGNLDAEKIINEPARFHSLAMETYQTIIQAVRKKVVQATIRAFIFILLTKITLAFVIEIPYDRMVAGKINYLSLAVNLLLPPFLMFISGAFVKSPPAKNYKLVSESISNIIFDNRIDNKKFFLTPKKIPRSYAVFNLFYSLVSVGILLGALKLLLILDFNIVSIILFFFFVSAVSFFSFRIRNLALELAMKRSRDDALTSSIEFIFLPFIRIGRYLSGQFANFNPFIIMLDFLIEAPLKTIIKIINSWLRFINTKKEEIEF